MKKYLWNRWTFFLLLIGVTIGAYVWWQRFHDIPVEAKYKFQTITQGDLTQTVSANGTLNPLVLVTVGSQVSGKIIRLYADFNDRVKEGQVLAELDPALFEAQLAQSDANLKSAQASLELADANLKRMRELFAQAYISKQELDSSIQAQKAARAAVDLAAAQRQKDATNLAYTVIKSPVSGVVIDRQIDVGQTVAASLQAPILFKIAQDLRQMQIDSSFAEADIGRIKEGQSVNFSVDAFPDRVFQGTVKQVRLNATTTSNVVTYDVVVTVENPEEILAPGMTAYVNVVLAQRQNALLVPNAALRYKPTSLKTKPIGTDAKGTALTQHKEKKEKKTSTVYMLENGLPKPIEVKVGITDNRLSEIVSDELHAGDQIIVEEVKDASAKKAVTPPPMGRPF
ncbi:MAG: efflux RND transporter periplasmic adaptor subunit [Sulfurospirillum cavolei]|nr:efflux RND transporter periplasmic adaptor subunit [Sulfurospirillum cavolei]